MLTELPSVCTMFSTNGRFENQLLSLLQTHKKPLTTGLLKAVPVFMRFLSMYLTDYLAEDNTYGKRSPYTPKQIVSYLSSSFCMDLRNGKHSH